MFIFLVVAFVRFIHRVECKNEERNAHRTVEDNSSAAAAMSVLLQYDSVATRENSCFIVSVVIASLLISLFIPVHIFKLANMVNILC